MKKIIFIFLTTLMALVAGGLFSCKVHQQPTVCILPFKIYDIRTSDAGFKYLYISRYRMNGRVPSIYIERGDTLKIGDYVTVDIRAIK